jgi:hypothetical protein
MFEFLIFASVIGAGCWGFNKWLAFQERQRFILPLETRPREAGQVIDVTGPRPLIHATQPPTPAASNIATSNMKYVMMALCVIYILSPLDFIPDFIPVLGWGDDLVAALIGVRQFFK